MPSPTFVRELADEAPRWVVEGLVTDEQAQRIQARYPRPAAPQESAASQVLYATAGVLLGAAAIALVLVGLDLETAPPLAFAALALLGAGIIVHATLPAQRLLADALLVASLVPLTITPFRGSNADSVAWLAPLVPAALLVWRSDRAFVQGLGVVAFTIGSGAAFFHYFEDNGAFPWVLGQLALLGALVVLDKTVREEENTVATALAAPALAASLVVFFTETFELSSSEAVEVAIGALMLAALVAGILLRHRGLAIGAATALAVDGIVFAFDFGGVFTGTVVLVVLAGLLIAQAEALKRYLGRDTA